ncbi:MAG: HI0074 family nucleotidyltransferase substrate-binding subunit [Pseudomonadota bacterium]
MKNKLTNVIKQFQDAVGKLDDVMQQKKDEYMRDSAIQRFEFTFELAWKAMKAFLEKEKGLKVYSPRDAIKAAFQVSLIGEDNTWIEMIETRNLTSHVYHEETAERVYHSIPRYLPLFKKLGEDIQEKIG